MEQFVDGVLTRVDYVNVQHTVWQPEPDLHQLDFGLVLTFADGGRLGLIWELSTGHLAALQGGLAHEFVGEVATTDVSGITPWRERIGVRLRAVSSGWPGEPVGEQACAVRLFFGDELEPIWIMAATLLHEPQHLMPCGDDVFVLTQHQFAALDVAHTIQSKDRTER